MQRWNGKGRNMKIEITIDGKEITATAYTESKVAKGVAKCSPEDQFDLAIGAKLAIDRVCEQLRPYVELLDGRFIGFIGEPTLLCDIDGNSLCVGDTVKLYKRETLSLRGERVICKKEGSMGFVMGIASENFENGRTGGWFIVKKRGHADIKDGEVVDGVIYHKPRL